MASAILVPPTRATRPTLALSSDLCVSEEASREVGANCSPRAQDAKEPTRRRRVQTDTKTNNRVKPYTVYAAHDAAG